MTSIDKFKKAFDSSNGKSIMSEKLEIGSNGKSVQQLQTLLNRVGASLAVDGKFGKKTDHAVKTVQKHLGLTADGVIGPRTWAMLLELASKGKKVSGLDVAVTIGKAVIEEEGDEFEVTVGEAVIEEGGDEFEVTVGEAVIEDVDSPVELTYGDAVIEDDDGPTK